MNNKKKKNNDFVIVIIVLIFVYFIYSIFTGNDGTFTSTIRSVFDNTKDDFTIVASYDYKDRIIFFIYSSAPKNAYNNLHSKEKFLGYIFIGLGLLEGGAYAHTFLGCICCVLLRSGDVHRVLGFFGQRSLRRKQ